MKTAHNIKAISKILFILLLVLAMIIGSIFSYMLIIGYYLNLESNVPDNPDLSITDVRFDPENAANFTITILNPTYSAGAASVTEISVTTADNKVHLVTETQPQLPTELKKGQSKNFTCFWNWGNYTGQTIDIIVIVDDGSGSTYTIKTTNVELTMSLLFSLFDTTQFNLTLTNPTTSAINLQVTNATITTKNGSVFGIELVNNTFPQTFLRGDEDMFQCLWNWTDYKGEQVTLTVHTLQNISFYQSETLPAASQFTFTNIIFDTANMTTFNMTTQISDPNITSASITTFGVIFKNQTNEQLTVTSPSPPYIISANETLTFEIMWNWEPYRGETVILGFDTEELDSGYFLYTIP